MTAQTSASAYRNRFPKTGPYWGLYPYPTALLYHQEITNGAIYHHILDPDTGYPVQNDLDQVTIISDRSVDGDALSTACYVLGLEDGMELVRSMEGIEAVFVTKDGELHTSSSRIDLAL